MAYFCGTINDAFESIEQRLISFELLQMDNRPFALFRKGDQVVEEPIMGYGQFEGEDGVQTIAPLILNENTGHLEIICAGSKKLAPR